MLLSKNRILNNRLEEMIKKTTDEQAGVMITLHDQNLRGADLTLPSMICFILNHEKTMFPYVI